MAAAMQQHDVAYTPRCRCCCPHCCREVLARNNFSIGEATRCNTKGHLKLAHKRLQKKGICFERNENENAIATQNGEWEGV